MKQTTTVLAALLCGMMLTTGCPTSRSGRVYTREQARTPLRVEYGTITSIDRDVMIEGTKTPIGAAAGGIMGGVLGSAVGGGSGKRIATVGGALGGAAAGAAAEEKLTKRAGIEITVRLEDGEVLSIVQEADKEETFEVGEKVRVLTAPDGSKRVRH